METKSLVTYQVIFKDVICLKFYHLVKNGTLQLLQTCLAMALAMDFPSLGFVSLFLSPSTAADPNEKDYKKFISQ